jgi:archaellum component FlaF (FlaF/FlaG flagellin family)
MARLGSFRRLYSSDFDVNYKSLIDQIGTTYNPNIEALYDALNKKLTFVDNFSVTITSFDVTVDNNGIPTRPTQVKLDDSQINSSLSGAIVLSAVGSKNPNLLPTAGVYVSFIKNEGYIIIKNIKGLQPDNPYNITILII